MSRSLLIEFFRSIRKSVSRFISLIIIVALGSCIFVGMKASEPDMKLTAEKYFTEGNLMDLRVQSTIGLTADDIKAISAVESVSYVMPAKFADALVFVNGEPEIDIDGSQISTRAYGMNLSQLEDYFNYKYKNAATNDGTFMNRPELIEGRYPVNINECLVDASDLSTPESFKVGAVISLEGDAGEDVDGLAVTEFTVVGIIRSPYYLSYERGNSLVGSGKIGTFIIIPDNAFNSDYYTEVYVRVSGSENYDPFSQEYFDYLIPAAEEISEVSTARLNVRTSQLAKTLPVQIAEGKVKYEAAKIAFDTGIAAAEQTIALYQRYVDDPDGAYAEAVEQFANKFGLAQSQYNGNETQYYSAVETYNRLLNEYNTKNQALQSGKSALDSARAQMSVYETQLNTAKTAVTTYSNTIKTMNTLISDTRNVLDQLTAYQNSSLESDQVTGILAVLQNAYPEIYEAVKSQSAQGLASEAQSMIETQLSGYQVELAAAEEGLELANSKIDEASEKLASAKAEVDAKTVVYNAAYNELAAANTSLQNFYDELQINKSNLTLAQVELMIGENSGASSLESFKLMLANADSYLEKAKTEYVNQKTEGEKKLLEAKNSIDSAEKLLAKLPDASWTVYDRCDTPGYTSYRDALTTINVLSNVFPVFFFIVSALVCLTTMTRMVEEERTQMGTLKALGYSDATIMSKYLLYAFFASFIGSALGVVTGIFALPFAVNKAYSVMFSMPELIFTMPVLPIAAGMGISVAIIMLATLFVCLKEISVRPAALMRPKAPKAGRRVLLERIGFIWKRLSFTSKVTVRNLARNKTRFIMTVFGIGGCMMLILGSIGFFTSLQATMSNQFGENGIDNYDYQLVFDAPQDPETSAMRSVLSNSARSFMFVSMRSVTGGSDSTDKDFDVYLFVPESAGHLSGYINLRNRTTGEKLELTDDGAIITEKLAKECDIGVGDSVKIEMTDGSIVYVPVTGITENYIFQYIYISEKCYGSFFGEDAKYLYAIGSLTDDIKNSADLDNAKAQLASDLMKYDSINAVAFISDTVASFEEVINVISFIVMLFIGAAAVLAFVVLYNLTNINISERHRELATIKVLGFTNIEVSRYIYRENIILTLLGIVVGIFGGHLLHRTMINRVSIDAIMFGQTIVWYDYLIAIAATVLFAVIVNLIMHKKMKKINMVESLKSVE